MRLTPSFRGATHSHAEELSELARELQNQGRSIIALNVGQPSTGAPAKALRAALKEIKTSHGYTPAAGFPELRKRIAKFYQEKYAVNINPERIIVTFGASGAFLLTFIGCFDLNQTIGVPLPCYYSYLNTLSTIGLKEKQFHPGIENHFQPTVGQVKAIADEIDGLLITSPANPTGSIIAPDQLQSLISYCESKNILVISDEIYHGITYNKKIAEKTALNFSENVIVINSFSKYFSMPGWRLGWMVVPEAFCEPLQKLARNLYISPVNASQHVALATFEYEKVLNKNIKHYARNRKIFLKEMPKAGFDKFPPLDGAFYLYAHVKHLNEDSVLFCKEMLRETGVLAAPGTDFDPIHGHHYVRFSYAGSTEEIQEATRRLIEWRKNKK